MKRLINHPPVKDRELWPGRWEIKVIGLATEGEAHVKLYQVLDTDEIKRLYKDLGLEAPLCLYEASQVEDTFSTEEMTIIRQFFSTYPDTLDIQVTQAHKPIVGKFIAGDGVECIPTGMAPFGDMYCGTLSFPDLDKQLGFGIGATITHFVTPDNKSLEYDSTLANMEVDLVVGMITDLETDEDRAKKELEADREATRRKLQAMIDADN